MSSQTTTLTTNDGLKRGVVALIAMTGVAGGILLALGAAEKKKSLPGRASNPVNVATKRAEALIRAVERLPDGVSMQTLQPIRNAILDVWNATEHRASALRKLKKEHQALVRLVKQQWTSDELAGVDWSEVERA